MCMETCQKLSKRFASEQLLTCAKLNCFQVYEVCGIYRSSLKTSGIFHDLDFINSHAKRESIWKHLHCLQLSRDQKRKPCFERDSKAMLVDCDLLVRRLAKLGAPKVT